MKEFFTLLICGLLSVPSAYSQVVTTWLGGDNAVNQVGSYGTKGVASSSNQPGSRFEACTCIDNDGNLMLFGGFGNAASGSANSLNDLWKWDGTNWTWLSGDNTVNQNGVYGTQGVASASNKPGSRYGAACWVDNSGNFWLFGGIAYGTSGGLFFMNDLWKWDGTNWTWVSGVSQGSSSGSYGTKGVADVSNVIPSRRFVSLWEDNSGNVWLFGGESSFGYHCDLWRWDGTYWTWMSGTSSTSTNGTYGTQGVASASNQPGGRRFAVAWKDDSDNFWLFGGLGRGATGGTGRLNDLWKWDGSNWTWISGSNSVNQTGVYGTQGVTSASNVPGGRDRAIGGKDAEGNFLLFGGDGYNATSSTGNLNDIWKWDGSNWTWMGGTTTLNDAGTYGTKGESYTSAVPRGRSRSSGVSDSNGNFFIFGGNSSTGGLNDFWRINTGPYWDGTSWNGGTPSSSTFAIIHSASANPGSFSCDDLYISGGNSLSVGSGNTVTVSGDLVNEGNGISGTGTLTFSNSGGTSQIRETAVSFGGVLTVAAGTTLQTNDKLTLTASSASSYGVLMNEGSVTGDVAVQAWLDLTGGASDGRYYFLGSPLTDAILSDFNNDGSTMVSVNNSNGTAWEWDASSAEWDPAGSGNLSSTAVNGKGYALYGGSNQWINGLRDDAGTIDLTGTATGSDVSIALGYNDGQSSSADFIGGTSVGSTQGWNLVANPYPAQYDWDSPTVPSLLGTAKYVWNGSAYLIYNNGIGSGSRYIPPFQAFWVQYTSDPGITGSLVFSSSKRTTNQSAELHKSASSSSIDGIYLHVYGSDSAHHDQLYAGFNAGATPGYDGNYDARKLLNAPWMPNLYIVFDQDWYSICLVPYSGPYSFPVGFAYPTQGETMTISADLAELHGFVSVKLEDLKTGGLHDLTAGNYVFTNDTAFGNDRFVLHFAQGVGVAEYGEHECRAWGNSQGIYLETNGREDLLAEVFTITGQKVAETREPGLIRVPAHGIYLVRLSGKDYFKTVKVIH